MKRSSLVSSRRTFLSMGVAGSTTLLVSPQVSTYESSNLLSIDPISELVALEVRLAEWVKHNSQQILEAPLSETRQNWIWVDYGFRWPAYTLAHLYTTQHPENSLYGEEWCLDLSIDLLDKEVAFWQYGRNRGRRISTGETPHYVAAFVLEMLADRIDSARRERWLDHESAWVAQALRRPLGMTGGYHDSWRMTALYRLGQVLEQPEWCDFAVFLFKRLLSLQTEEGFWEDGRHHGPSARYCGLMLPSLAWMYRWTGDEEFGQAARKLADFMATFVYPDGVTVGAFDGRNSNCLAYFPICPGFELTTKGRAYNSKAFRLWQEMGMLTDISKAAQSTRDLARLAFYCADTCRYLSLFAQQAEAVLSSGPLPIDQTETLQNHSTQFDGVMLHQGPWVAALSGQNSDIQGAFRLDRESRIEIWHEKTRLIVGGGHHRQDWRIPFANAILDTGFDGPTEFGVPVGKGMNRVPRIYYKPRIARSEATQNYAKLVLVFGHGIVSFQISFPSAERAVISAQWEVRQLERLCLQFPVTIWKGSQVFVDEEELQQKVYLQMIGRNNLRVRSPFEGGFTFHLPKGVPTRIHYPLSTGVFHGGAEKHRESDPVSNPYDILLVSCQWSHPETEGETRFQFRCE